MVFEHEYACTYIDLCTQANYMRTHTSSLHTNVEACAHKHTLNSNPATQKHRKIEQNLNLTT